MSTSLILPRETVFETTSRDWLNLSLAQQAVWLDARLSDASEYQLGGWVRIAETLDEDAVRQTIALVMARHDALRLRVDDELPRQWLDTVADPPLTILGLPPGEDMDSAFKAHVDRLFALPLPLGDASLFEVHLFRGAGASFLLWRFHHLIADSASVAIVQQLWANAFEALASGTPRELAPASSYLKVLASDAAYVASPAYDHDLAYWIGRFDPLPPPLIADMKHRPAARQSMIRGEAAAGVVIEGDLLAALHAAAGVAGSNAPRALFALFMLVLARRHGHWDLICGVALHRRDTASRSTVGMLAGVMGVRCQFEPYWTLEEGVEAFSEQFDADLRHQRMPLDIIARNLDIAASGRSGLFEAAMSYMPLQSAAPPVAGLTGGAVSTREASPISFHMEDAPGGGLDLRVVVNSGFLDPTEAGTLLSLLEGAVEAFTAAPGTRLEDLPALTAAERASLDAWNSTAATFPSRTLEALFAAQATATPDAIAILSPEGDATSYAVLDARSTRLARQLAGVGVRPGQTVGVQMPRSPETIVALLAVLKAGAVYLPLDPAYPTERLAFMARDASAVHILTSADVAAPEAELPLPATLADPSRRAYIIYTSGTTGQPKGVAVGHAAAVNLAHGRCAAHDAIGPGDRILAAISVGFDVSIGQLLLPLLKGATVVVAPELRTLAATEFWSYLTRHRVTHINSVPSFFDSILDAAPPAGSLALKRLMLGGEALTGALVERLHRALAGVEVVNMYGPTETCIDATFHIATAADRERATLPIGRPLPNYKAYVLTPELELTGIGVSGELFVGGDGVAEGYLNLAELTASRFLTSPFGGDGRLYRTGDRARWTFDGELEFLGRVDQQVKIRGFRVEPAEVAAVLLQHPGIAQAAVIAAPGPSGLRLIAYFVSTLGAEPDAASLRAHAAASLPNYMVPSAFLSLRALPLTQNGKLDVKALPKPENAANTFLAPRTPTETAVAAAFAEVLGLERCGVSSNFFELGGHSLLAATLTSRLRALGVKLPLRAVFDAPTVEGLARRIDLSLHDATASERIVAGPRAAATPLSFPQERLWFLGRLQGEASCNIPVAVEMRGMLDGDALEAGLRRIVERHEILRTCIVLRNGQPTQEVMAQASPFFVKVDLTRLSVSARESALSQALADLASTPLDLSAGLSLAVRLFTLADDRHVIGTIVHHAAFDGWSVHILLSELQQLYSTFCEGLPDPLPALSIQYADFAIWQRAQGNAASRAFWLKALAGAPALSQLPPTLDEAAGEIKRSAARMRVEVDGERYVALTRLARLHNASLFMVLHAALALHLARAAGQDDIVIGTVVANRERQELEPLIGCFVNTLPLRTRILPEDTFSKLLDRVKDTVLAAFAHQDQPFEETVRLLQAEEAKGGMRSLQTTPLFQVMLVLQNTPRPSFNLPDLALEVLAIPPVIAQFDLTLDLTEDASGLSGFVEYATDRYNQAGIEAFTAGYLDLLDSVAAEPKQAAKLTTPAAPASRPLKIIEAAPAAAFVAPAGSREETLAALWRELLHVDRVGREDNFFELGGHSLLTITLIERLAQQDLELDIRALFTEPTLAGVAALIRETTTPAPVGASIPVGTTTINPEHIPLAALTQAQIDRIVAALPGGATNLQDVYPLAPLQEGILFQHLMTPAADPYVAPFLLALDTRERLEVFLAALNQVVARHDVLRTAMLWSQVDRPLQVVLRRATVPVDNFTPAGTGGVEEQLLQAFRSGTLRLTLDVAPLMRAVAAFDAEHGRWLLLLLTHHLVLDHMSMEIVVAELRALMQNVVADLPRPIPYRDFVEHTLAEAQLAAHRDFFATLLSDVTEPTAPLGLTGLPAEHTPAEMREARLRLDGALSRGLRARAAMLGVSAASLFHLAWAVVLGHVSARRDVVFGTVLIGRMNSGAHAARAVGMFINTLPMRVELDSTGAAASALATHTLLQQLLLHEHTPLAVAQRASGVAAPLPLITSLFNFRHSPEPPDAGPWPGVSMVFAEERTNYPVAIAVDDTGHDFLLTATTVSTVDAERLCVFLSQTVRDLLVQLEHTPDGQLNELPALPPVTIPVAPLKLPVDKKPQGFEAPRNAAETTLQEIWLHILELPSVGIHDDFFHVGGDSLSAMRLLSAINAALGVDLPIRTLMDSPTIAGMAAGLAAEPEDARQLVALQPNGTRPPLFCVHPAGGYVFCYLPLVREVGRLLADDQPFFGLQAQGLEGDQPLPESIEEAAALCLLAVRAQQPEGPYQLLGMSSGGLIAFEMARQLHDAGETVSLLAMLDTAVPTADRDALSAQTLLLAMAAELGCADLLGGDLPPATLVDLVARAQEAGRLPGGFSLAHAERIARVFANTARIHNRYEPVRLPCPVLLFRATERLHAGDVLPDWGAFLSQSSQVVDLECGHADLVSREMAPAVSRLLVPRLSPAARESAAVS